MAPFGSPSLGPLQSGPSRFVLQGWRFCALSKSRISVSRTSSFVGAGGADLLCQQRDRTDVVQRLAAGTMVEALDYAGNWCWCCLGPEGPSGYLHLTELEPAG